MVRPHDLPQTIKQQRYEGYKMVQLNCCNGTDCACNHKPYNHIKRRMFNNLRFDNNSIPPTLLHRVRCNEYSVQE
mgnify:FL=1